MSREDRKALIRAIEEKRESKVIAYIMSDRTNLSQPMSGDAVSILHDHILAFEPCDDSKIDLLLYSRGGDADIPWSIVSMFREYCAEGSFSVLLPYRAHSAATVLALGADEIVMTKKAELGPIDATITGPYNQTDPETKQRLPVAAEDVMGYFSLLERLGCGRPEEMREGFGYLTKQVHPLVLGHVSRILEHTRLVALRLLSTRSKPFPEEENREIVRRFSEEISSHRHTISRTEAIDYLGLDQVVRASECKIDEELWNLYLDYRDMFSLGIPFYPDQYLLEHDLEEHIWPDLNMTCIESLGRLDTFKTTVRFRRLRKTPPTITISLNDLKLPPVTIPEFPEGLTPEERRQMVADIVKSVVQLNMAQLSRDLSAALLKSMPIAGFERTLLKSEWTMEAEDE